MIPGKVCQKFLFGKRKCSGSLCDLLKQGVDGEEILQCMYVHQQVSAAILLM